jgi:hypothetical protein
MNGHLSASSEYRQLPPSRSSQFSEIRVIDRGDAVPASRRYAIEVWDGEWTTVGLYESRAVANEIAAIADDDPDAIQRRGDTPDHAILVDPAELVERFQ